MHGLDFFFASIYVAWEGALGSPEGNVQLKHPARNTQGIHAQVHTHTCTNKCIRK